MKGPAVSVHLVLYSSKPVVTSEFAIPALVDDILRVTRRRNCIDGISGAMLFGESRFIQVIEGEPDAVRNTFERIRRDPRHTDIETIIDAETPCRYFAEWEMAYLGDKLGLLGLYPFSRVSRVGRRMSGNKLIEFMNRMARNQLDDYNLSPSVPDVTESTSNFEVAYEPKFPRFIAPGSETTASR